MADHPSSRFAMTGIHEAAGTRITQLRNLTGSMGPEVKEHCAPHIDALEAAVRADYRAHGDDDTKPPRRVAEGVTVSIEDVVWPVSRCRSESCGAEIIWAMTDSGRRNPVDRFPPVEGGGTIKLTFKEKDQAGRAVAVHAHVLTSAAVASMTDDERVWLRTSHFATCPDSEAWKSKPKGAGRAR